MPFSKVLYIEQDDFREDPPKDFFRLAPGREVRLRYAYFIRCASVVKDAAGNVVELRCTYDPATKRRRRPRRPQGEGDDPLGRRRRRAVDAEVRLYDHLFNKPDPDDAPEGQTFLANLNPKSLEVLTGCKLEPSVAGSRGRQDVPVRAARLLLRGQGLDARQAGVQPHGDAARHLGQDREEGEGVMPKGL